MKPNYINEITARDSTHGKIAVDSRGYFLFILYNRYHQRICSLSTPEENPYDAAVEFCIAEIMRQDFYQENDKNQQALLWVKQKQFEELTGWDTFNIAYKDENDTIKTLQITMEFKVFFVLVFYALNDDDFWPQKNRKQDRLEYFFVKICELSLRVGLCNTGVRNTFVETLEGYENRELLHSNDDFMLKNIYRFFREKFITGVAWECQFSSIIWPWIKEKSMPETILNYINDDFLKELEVKIVQAYLDNGIIPNLPLIQEYCTIDTLCSIECLFIEDKNIFLLNEFILSYVTNGYEKKKNPFIIQEIVYAILAYLDNITKLEPQHITQFKQVYQVLKYFEKKSDQIISLKDESSFYEDSGRLIDIITQGNLKALFYNHLEKSYQEEVPFQDALFHEYFSMSAVYNFFENFFHFSRSSYKNLKGFFKIITPELILSFFMTDTVVDNLISRLKDEKELKNLAFMRYVYNRFLLNAFFKPKNQWSEKFNEGLKLILDRISQAKFLWQTSEDIPYGFYLDDFLNFIKKKTDEKDIGDLLTFDNPHLALLNSMNIKMDEDFIKVFLALSTSDYKQINTDKFISSFIECHNQGIIDPFKALLSISNACAISILNRVNIKFILQLIKNHEDFDMLLSISRADHNLPKKIIQGLPEKFYKDNIKSIEQCMFVSGYLSEVEYENFLFSLGEENLLRLMNEKTPFLHLVKKIPPQLFFKTTFQEKFRKHVISHEDLISILLSEKKGQAILLNQDFMSAIGWSILREYTKTLKDFANIFTHIENDDIPSFLNRLGNDFLKENVGNVNDFIFLLAPILKMQEKELYASESRWIKLIIEKLGANFFNDIFKDVNNLSYVLNSLTTGCFFSQNSSLEIHRKATFLLDKFIQALGVSFVTEKINTLQSFSRFYVNLDTVPFKWMFKFLSKDFFENIIPDYDSAAYLFNELHQKNKQHYFLFLAPFIIKDFECFYAILKKLEPKKYISFIESVSYSFIQSIITQNNQLLDLLAILPLNDAYTVTKKLEYRYIESKLMTPNSLSMFLKYIEMKERIDFLELFALNGCLTSLISDANELECISNFLPEEKKLLIHNFLGEDFIQRLHHFHDDEKIDILQKLTINQSIDDYLVKNRTKLITIIQCISPEARYPFLEKMSIDFLKYTIRNSYDLMFLLQLIPQSFNEVFLKRLDINFIISKVFHVNDIVRIFICLPKDTFYDFMKGLREKSLVREISHIAFILKRLPDNKQLEFMDVFFDDLLNELKVSDKAENYNLILESLNFNLLERFILKIDNEVLENLINAKFTFCLLTMHLTRAMMLATIIAKKLNYHGFYLEMSGYRFFRKIEDKHITKERGLICNLQNLTLQPHKKRRKLDFFDSPMTSLSIAAESEQGLIQNARQLDLAIPPNKKRKKIEDLQSQAEDLSTKRTNSP
jgi:hypothetical protein